MGNGRGARGAAQGGGGPARRRARSAAKAEAGAEGSGREGQGGEVKRAKLAAVPVAARVRRAPAASFPAPWLRTLLAAGLRRPST